MQHELKLSDIAPSLQHELKVQTKDGIGKVIGIPDFLVNKNDIKVHFGKFRTNGAYHGFGYSGDNPSKRSNYGYYSLSPIMLQCLEGGGILDLSQSFAKPILYDLSFLTKPIKHNGKTFIPLIELFQIVAGGSYTKENVNIEIHDQYYLISTSISELKYYPKQECFIYSTFTPEGEDWYPSFNQKALFEKMYQYRLDVKLLIPKGKAICVSTLEKNCYE